MPFTRGAVTPTQGVGGMFNYGADYPATYRNLRRLRAAKARVRNGVLTATAYSTAPGGVIACVGDSNTRGTGSGTSSGGTGAMQGYNGWPVKLAKMLTDRGIKAQCENFFASGGYEGAFASYDDRISFSGTGITTNGGAIVVPGGHLFTASAVGSMTFAPKTAVSQCDFYYISTSSAGTFTYAVDGGSTTTVDASAAAKAGAGTSMQKVTIALGALGTHTVAIAWASGTVYMIGFDCYDATTSLMRIWNFGWHGSKASDWSGAGTSVWSPLTSMQNFWKPDLIVGPVLETNDMNTTNNASVSTVSSNKQALITAWSAASDILLLTMGPTAATTEPSLAGQKPYIDADYALAIANKLPLLDEWAAMGDLPTMQALGIYNGDLLHKTAAGHFATAEIVANAVIAV